MNEIDTSDFSSLNNYNEKIMMNRPRITIQRKPIDWVIEFIGIVGLIILIGLPIIYFSELPDIIPVHFGFNGQPDGFGTKAVIWVMPLLGGMLYLGMSLLNKHPHIFNYPQKVTEDNAERLYKTATRMMRVLNALVACIFAYITFAIIQTALGNHNGLGTIFMIILLILILGITIYSSYKLRQRGQSQTADSV